MNRWARAQEELIKNTCGYRAESGTPGAQAINCSQLSILKELEDARGVAHIALWS